MKNKVFAGLLLGAVLATSACAPQSERVSTETPIEIPMIGLTPDEIPMIGLLDGEHSIQRVRVAMTDPEIQRVIVDTERELRDTATEFDTTFEFERDILVCEQIYVTLEPEVSPAYFDDPTASALSECINGSIASHDMMEGGE